MEKKIKVGLDFDGVVAYNPFRVVRAPLAYFKRNILGMKKLQFWYPKTSWQKIFWIIIHDSSVFPAEGINLLQEMIENERIEAHLITGRYSFLEKHLYQWLDKHKLRNIFKTINWNKRDEQPHFFKEKMIKKYDLEIFIEDNLDIVSFLHRRVKTKIYWIYNITDRHYFHPHKYPYLKKALEAILKDTKKQRHKNSKY